MMPRMHCYGVFPESGAKTREARSEAWAFSLGRASLWSKHQLHWRCRPGGPQEATANDARLCLCRWSRKLHRTATAQPSAALAAHSPRLNQAGCVASGMLGTVVLASAGTPERSLRKCLSLVPDVLRWGGASMEGPRGH